MDDGSVKVSRGMWDPQKILKSRVSVMPFPACIRREPWLLMNIGVNLHMYCIEFCSFAVGCSKDFKKLQVYNYRTV